jgi:hypothetical protein
MRRVLGFFLCCSVWLSPASAGILDWLLPKHDVQVITVTDATPRGALLRAASPANPVYYAAINAGYREFGGIIAGEKIPPAETVVKTIAKVLAKQGYLPSTTDHPPTLLLIWTWGTLNTDRFIDPSSDDTEGRQINRQQMLRFLGAYKYGLVSKEPAAFQDDLMPGLFYRGADAEMIADAATDDLYIAAIAAYDYRLAAQKQKVLLWTTKISCPSRGLMLPEALPAMLAIAGPYIGRETAHPVWINASDKFKPEVSIGDPKVIEYIDNNKLPVVDAPRNLRKPKSPAPAAPVVPPKP